MTLSTFAFIFNCAATPRCAGGTVDALTAVPTTVRRVVQVDPMKPKLKPPGTNCLKLNCDVLLSTSAFKFNLRRYTSVRAVDPRQGGAG